MNKDNNFSMSKNLFRKSALAAALAVCAATNIQAQLLNPVTTSESGTDGYQLVFSDEFDGPDKTQPDANKWVRCVRQGATWNRWLSDSEEVIYLEDGRLIARAIPNPDQQTDPVPMITGGVKTRGKFSFKYGKLECRALNHPWSGNFPAIWLMPDDDSAGWPACGEIDIFEAIDDSRVTWHTLHSHWIDALGQRYNPQYSFTGYYNLDEYHVYGLEWDENTISWYVDGTFIGSYAKSTNQRDLDDGQWPFDKPFYVILNQSVGDGSWAKYADVNHTYVTEFDWIRIYQKPGQENSNGTVAVDCVQHDDLWNVRTTRNAVIIEASAPTLFHICTLQGETLFHEQIDGSRIVSLAEGIYIVNGRKIKVG